MLDWFAAIVGLAATATTLLLWQALLSHERSDAMRIVKSLTESIKSEIALELEEPFDAFSWMVRRWQNGNAVPSQAWGADANAYLSHDPSYRALGWIDTSLRLHWITRRMDNGLAPGADLGADAQRRQALAAAARARSEFVVQGPSRPIGEGTWLEVYVPVIQGTSLSGFFVGVFDVQSVLDTLFNNVARRYRAVLNDGGREIYRYPRTLQALKTPAWGEAGIGFHGETWSVRVWPSPGLLAEMGTRIPALVLVGGLLGSLLLGWSVHLAQAERHQANKLRDANQEIKKQMAERLLAENALRERETSYRALARIFPAWCTGCFCAVIIACSGSAE
jgi:sensor domain CHASE-containing protein